MVAAPWCGYTTLSPTRNDMRLLGRGGRSRKKEYKDTRTTLELLDDD
jgi:hypothetical protein